MRHARGELVAAMEHLFLVDAWCELGASGSAIYTKNWELYGILLARTHARLWHCHERSTYTHVTEGCFLKPMFEALGRRHLHLKR